MRAHSYTAHVQEMIHKPSKALMGKGGGVGGGGEGGGGGNGIPWVRAHESLVRLV